MSSRRTNINIKTKLVAGSPKIAPQPCLQGLGGAVGLDVSKAQYHACYLAEAGTRPRTGVFACDGQGHAKFLRWLEQVGAGQSVTLCLEETGCYGRALGAFLHQAGHQVSLVNAALIKSFGSSLNLRTKNDGVDAQLIARYALERTPRLWVPLAAQHQQLRDASRRRAQIMEMIQQEKGHLETSPSETMSSLIGQSLRMLQAQLDEINQLMDRIVASDAQLKLNEDLLQSIPGIGAITATRLLAELPALDSFENARQLCAYAGLTPRENQSGTSLRGKSRLCKQGRPGLRTLMFMPAVSLMSSKSGPLHDFAERLLKAGKKPACVVGALMRKLLALAFAILRSGQRFDPHYRHSCAKAKAPKK